MKRGDEPAERELMPEDALAKMDKNFKELIINT